MNVIARKEKCGLQAQHSIISIGLNHNGKQYVANIYIFGTGNSIEEEKKTNNMN